MDEPDGKDLINRKSAFLRTLSLLFFAFYLVVACSHGVRAQSIPTASDLRIENADELRDIGTALQERGSVVFRDTPLHEVLYILGEQWKLNIVAGANVSGFVSGQFREATLREILDAILTVNGYGYRQNGRSLVVMQQEQLGPNNPNFRAETLLMPDTMSVENMAEVVETLGTFSSPNGGKIQSLPSSKHIVIYDSPEQITRMRQVLSTLTGNGNSQSASGFSANNIGGVSPAIEFITIRPQYISVADVSSAIALAIGPAGAFTPLASEAAIVVSGSPEVVMKAAYAARQVDVPRPQVRITAYIYDISLNEAERLGFDWSSQSMSRALDANGIPVNNVRSDGGLLTRNAPASPVQAVTTTSAAAGTGTAGVAAAAAAPTGGQWYFRTLSSNWELSAVLQALDTTKGAKLLADPHVTVVDRETAAISIVTKIPIQQLTQTQQGGAIGTTAFEEAGIKLNVTPRIAGDGTVEMVVEPEFSTLNGFSASGNPIIDARRAKTTVRVGHQHTLVLGGLRQKSTVETVSGIPGLMNIKYIGRLFQNHNTEQRESELICFIQPEIIDYCATGLPRDEIAIGQLKRELSHIPVACPGPHVPDCKDPNCPYHHPRKRPNPGLSDDGLINPLNLQFNQNFETLPPPTQTFPAQTSNLGVPEVSSDFDASRSYDRNQEAILQPQLDQRKIEAAR